MTIFKKITSEKNLAQFKINDMTYETTPQV